MSGFLQKISAKLATFYEKWQAVLITAPSITAIVIGVNHLGVLQILEWAAYDQFFRLRPEETISQRITIVTIDESDLTELDQWPLSDATIAQTINLIKAENPRVIALDIYRDLKVEPGHDQLVEVLQSTPNLIGVEKVSGRPVAPSPILAEKGQVAIADLVVDPDSKVRRALLSVQRPDGKIQVSLGTQAALDYLEKEDINLTPVADETGEENSSILQLGQATFEPLNSHDGAYINADNGGYQVLLNYRGLEDKFPVIALKDLLKNNFNPNLIRGRIVFIGSIAESLNDQFYTPFSSILSDHPLRTGGVVIHANISSHILSAALNERPLIKVISNQLEWKFILICSLIGAIIAWELVVNRTRQPKIYSFTSVLLISMMVPGIVLVGFCYYLFLNGWWIPIIAPALAMFLSAFSVPVYQNFTWQKIAYIDSLTKLHNRRYFDSYLAQLWEEHKEKKMPLSLILCDVDYFKLYNDRYGHPEGDKCLQAVAQGILSAVRKTDLAARFGGEEFVILLPNTNPSIAMSVAQRVCLKIKELELEHESSKINNYVTVSCGSASIVPDKEFSPKALIDQADIALYKAKESGRDRAYPK
ncbi:CHASE2 domain-containing protein [Crocosphaera sp.]|uniref:CHASE2 domain-containing protein n=1 Tax=Crocosphaera sp. TaxID=2729996 RepID=UPI003F24406D|nr:diguanylate cyclase [Crocosphaera sp.]